MKGSISKGQWIGGVLLITGSCIGAGMLALPIITGIAGFIPSLLVFLIAWGFMTITGLLLVEVTSSFRIRVNIVSMAERAFGYPGKVIAWILYLFLFYSLLVAYISGSSQLTSVYVHQFLSRYFPSWIGAVFFTLGFGILAYRGTRIVDYWNRFFMLGKILSYLGMVCLGLSYVDAQLLKHYQPLLSFFSLPILVIAFGYHNMIPTLMTYMKNDAFQVRKMILVGSFLALLIYLIWEFVVLGIVPLNGEWGIYESLAKGRQSSDSIVGIIGVNWVSYFAEALAFFALLSSFLAQTLALVHFLADALKMKGEKNESIPLCILALLPPLIFALIYPHLFIKALNFAGGICAVLLFGVLPSLLAWNNRYLQNNSSTYQLGGGRKLLIGVIIIAFCIVLIQLATMFHFISYV